MKWFEGNIPEAIGAAKTENAVFVVYVHDSSDASKATDAALADEDISAQLSSVKYVAIQLEIGTEGATQFSQIYPLVLVPSLFFISGQTGMPLEVLGGPLNKENLKEKLTKLTSDKEASNEKQKEESPSNAVMPGEEAASCDGTVSPSTSGAEAVTVQGAESSEATPVQPSDSKDCANDIDGVESTDPSVEERVRRAKELLAEKQEREAQEKIEIEKQKELDRRKMGQEIARKKHEQEHKEMKDAAQERRKEKQEDKIARERVKAQIAADRAEREARAAILRGEQPAAPEPAPVPSTSNAVPSNSNITRLKFRLADGSSSIAQFPSDATLAEVRRHIVENIPLESHNFSLTATVHPRPFTSEDLSRTLSELGLVPSAILVILPMSSAGSRSVSPSGGGIMGLFWILLSPITFLLGLIKQVFGGGRGPHHPPSTSDEEPVAKRLKEDESNTTTQRPKTAYGKRGEARLRRDGNIHRLRNDDDDNDNNTWNGNSTQQM